MKLFQATIYSVNRMCVKGVVVVAKDETQADRLLRKYTGETPVPYKDKLREIEIDFNKPAVIDGFGHGYADSGFSSLDD